MLRVNLSTPAGIHVDSADDESVSSIEMKFSSSAVALDKDVRNCPYLLREVDLDDPFMLRRRESRLPRWMKQHPKPWIRKGGVTLGLPPEIRALISKYGIVFALLGGYLKQHVKRLTAGWSAALLDKASAVTIDKKPPAHMSAALP